jgi:hypothetical protein
MSPLTSRAGKKQVPSQVTQKQLVTAIAKKHGVPPWLLWGIYGAESTYGTNGNNYFGLIEPEYKMANGNTRVPHNTANLAESADIAAELLASLKKEHGSWAAAVAQYAPYSIQHPKELSRGGGEQGKHLVSFQSGIESFGGNALEYLVPGLGFGGAGKLEEGAGKAAEEAAKSGVPGLQQAGEVGSFLSKASKLLFTPEGWLQVGQVIGGVVLIGWGLHHLIDASTGVNVASATAKKAAKAAEVAAVVK